MAARFSTIFNLFFLLSVAALAQNITHEMVNKGIESFYMADFEDAMNTLQNAIINETLSHEEQFYAHVFVGFCHLRQGADAETVNLYFKRAITVSPTTELDPMKIPPDLYDAFIAVKNSALGSIVVMSEPLDATVLVVEASSNAIERKTTPASFRNLLEGPYQVLVSKDGYETYAAPVEVYPGLTDTLNVVLLKKHKSVFAKYWPYGAGAIAATAAIVVIAGGGDKPGPGKPPVDLPEPPGRP